MSTSQAHSRASTSDSLFLAALVVDDEEPARRGIRARLRELQGIEVIGECENGQQAVEAIREKRPDIVFLDVQMPGLDGFDVVETIGAEVMPPVVFVTAYDQHALRAFETQALDYLLKPIDTERLEESVTRAKQRQRSEEERALGRRLKKLLNDVGRTEEKTDQPTAEADQRERSTKNPQRFTVKSGRRIRFIEVCEIAYVEGAGDYVKLHVDSGDTHLKRATMAEMQEALGSEAFVRIHRSTIVRCMSVRELRPSGSSAYTAILDDGTKLKVSRGYRDAALTHLGAGG